MAQINLAPGSQYLVIVRRRRRILYGISGLIALLAIIVGSVLTIAVSRVEKTQETLTQDLQRVETSIAKASDDVKRIQFFEKRLTILDALLHNHKTWSIYLQEIERLLPPETVLTLIKGNYNDGTLELTGSTSNIDRAAETLASLQNQPVTHATLFSSGTIRSVEHAAEVGPQGEILGQRYNFNMSLSLHIPDTN